jgi:hypothetical protein
MNISLLSRHTCNGLTAWVDCLHALSFIPDNFTFSTKFLVHVSVFIPFHLILLNFGNRSCLSCQPKWELEKHLETCTFSVIACPSKGCGKMVRRSQLDEHLLSCLNRNFHCPNKKLGCHKKLTFIESNDHSPY